jgi:hypothetical protein
VTTAVEVLKERMHINTTERKNTRGIEIETEIGIEREIETDSETRVEIIMGIIRIQIQTVESPPRQRRRKRRRRTLNLRNPPTRN